MGNRKRSRDQFEEDFTAKDPGPGDVGVGATLAYLRAPELAAADGPLRPDSSPNGATSERTPGDGGWTKVSKSAKRRHSNRLKKDDVLEPETKPEDIPNDKSKYPSLTYTELHKLQSMTRLGDLQTLLMYCLAEGTAPQFVSVRNRAAIQKAVVLLVPGLEKGIFDGTTPLPEPSALDKSSEEPKVFHESENETNSAEAGSSNAEQKPPQAIPQSHIATQTADRVGNEDWSTNLAPDNYLPLNLDVEKLPASLHSLADLFVHVWPIKAPGDDKYSKVHSPLHAMLTSHVSKTQEEKEAANKAKAQMSNGGKHWDNVPTPINAFLTSNEELQENDYTLHPVAFDTEEEKLVEAKRRRAAKEAAEDGWVDTAVGELKDGDIPESSIAKGSLTAGRTVFAMDCEMCTVEGGEAALTRISLVNWDGTVVIDEPVKPDKPITDYLTPYSGMTAAKLAPVTTTLHSIQFRLLTLLTPHTILIGHSLNSDLTALKLTHPFIIDTSLLYPHPRGPPLKSSLKYLAQKYLNREIQKGHGAMGHDSIEDARACLDLVRMKCEKGPGWGSQEAERESIFKRLARVPKNGTVTGTDQGKQGAIVDHGAPERNFGQMAAYSIGCSSDADVVNGIRRAVNGDPDGLYIPGGGVDFTWARFRELEALRGWSNDNRNPSPNSSTRAAADPSPEQLSAAVKQTAQHIKAVHESLPPRTLLIVYSGTGDPRELARLQEIQRRFKREYKVRKWDELSVKWTDKEEQELKRACRRARKGVGFVCVK